MSLRSIQKETLEKVVSLSLTRGFYLAGGTALAIRYSHRPSEDFDFFSFPDFSFRIDDLTEKLKNSSAKIISLQEGTLIFLLEGVKFSFFRYTYPLLEEPQFHRQMGVSIAGDRDIACMKAVAIAQRGLKKDFYDLWFLMKERGITLSRLLENLSLKYINYDTGIFLRALTYFDDADREINPAIDSLWSEVKNFILSSVKEELKGSIQKQHKQ